MTTNPKRPSQSFKSTQWRELRLLRYFFPERIHSGEFYSGNSLRKEGKTVRKLFWEECCSNLFITSCWLGELTNKFWINTEFEYWYLTIAAPSSSQGDQSKLGGPEESLFERSPGVGREETASHCCCCPKLKQVLSLNCLVLVTVNGWMLC